MMRVAIFSDIHGNLPAFELLLKNAGKVDLYVSLGDVINYGPWSNECVDLLDSLKNSIKIKGNHEEFFLKKRYDGDKLSLAGIFFGKCLDDFREFKKLETYIDEYQLNKYFCSHTIGDLYVYPDTDLILERNYIIGHSHYQFALEKDGFTLYNVGSVGQNRAFINLISYIILDSENDKVEFKNIKYNVDIVIDEMRARNFDEKCINYYLSKKRI